MQPGVGVHGKGISVDAIGEAAQPRTNAGVAVRSDEIALDRRILVTDG
jgi:hypothetical protein